MNRKHIGIGLSTVGFAVAVIAGLLLAARFSAPEAELSQLIALAALVFVPIAVLMGSGLYLFLKDEPGESVAETSHVYQQREMMDILRSQGRISMLDMALELRLSVQEVQDLIRDMQRLGVFDGYVDWESAMIYAHRPGQLLDAP